MSLSFDFDHIILMYLYSFHCANRSWELSRGRGELDRKGWPFFLGGGGAGGVRGFLKIVIMYFTSQVLFDLLFMCRQDDVL